MPRIADHVNKESFALRLLELQERAGLTQADVVRRAEGAFKQSHYSTWARGVSAPNILYLEAIAKALGCEPWELLEDPTPGFKPTPSKHARRGDAISDDPE